MLGKTDEVIALLREITRTRSALALTLEVALCGGSRLSGRRDSAKLSALSQLQCNRSLASSCGGNMSRSGCFRGLMAMGLVVGMGVSQAVAGKGNEVPAPAADATLAARHGEESVVFAGGCFWGIQAVFQHVKGVINATSGYSGGEAKTAEYETVST